MISRRVLLSAALVALPSIARAQEAWTTYRNTRFGTSIEYPARFRAGRPPENNDGLSFTAADGATLSVWGSLNVEEHDIAGLEAFLRENPQAGEQITYRASGANWLVLSGTRGERVFYQRHLISHRGEIINAFAISYPAAFRGTYDPIVGRLSRSLRPGGGYQTTGKP
jgi:serine/threonine-protein kinase